jgi:hypothetical protein
VPAKAAASKAKTTPLEHRDVVVWQLPGFSEPLEQRPLTFFGKNEFFAVVSQALDLSMQRGIDFAVLAASLDLDRTTLKGLASGAINVETLPMMQNLAHLVLRVFGTVPEFLPDLFMIALNVPHAARPGVREVVMNIDDETGFGILQTFIDQNATTLQDFGMRWVELVKSARARIQTKSTESPATSTKQNDSPVVGLETSNV